MVGPSGYNADAGGTDSTLAFGGSGTPVVASPGATSQCFTPLTPSVHDIKCAPLQRHNTPTAARHPRPNPAQSLLQRRRLRAVKLVLERVKQTTLALYHSPLCLLLRHPRIVQLLAIGRRQVSL